MNSNAFSVPKEENNCELKIIERTSHSNLSKKSVTSSSVYHWGELDLARNLSPIYFLICLEVYKFSSCTNLNILVTHPLK